ncbi:MAG: uroporphyrinogen-III synthase, partial [Verrucomicrobia bacterium]|nr:uroporphyrinogen-III synthase [Verrucomicrobiota bacterium]
DLENLNVLLLRAQVAQPDLPRELMGLGAIVDDVACYKTVPETGDINGCVAQFEKEGADWITFSSASTVENFHARFDLPQRLKRWPGLRLASIGPETTKAIEALGLKPDAVAKQHNIDGLVKAVLDSVGAAPKKAVEAP